MKYDKVYKCEPGYLEPEIGERTICVKQDEILGCSDLITQTKSFNLTLDQFGPYKISYNSNGKRLLIGGSKGHIASFDWCSKNLLFEVQVRDHIRALTWLHDETMLAVAQKKKVFVYDINGIELHKIKCLHEAMHLDFLPHHFLLVSARKSGSLTYFDTSIGKMVSDIKTYLGEPVDMCQNAQNAIIALGHINGNVTMWCPMQDKPVVKMLCHSSPLSSLAIDHTGQYMATGDTGRFVKIWDLRTFKIVNEFRVFKGAFNMCFSQTGLLALSLGNRVDIYKDISTQPVKYLRYNTANYCTVTDLQFCPFEDVLGIAHEKGFDSMIVPGAGEAKIDSLIPNPYQTKSQRREYGVKKLLEKIQPEMITLDTNALAQIVENEKSHEEIQQEMIFKRLLPSKPRSKNSKSASKASKQIYEQISREKRRLKNVMKVKSKQPDSS